MDKLLKEKGISLYALSQESGVPYSTLSDIKKNGIANTRLSNVEAIASALGYDGVDTLLEDIRDND